ncbi:MAG: transglutaminaseTgpA domain-containing protein [Succinivibrionaceae bacterium]
MNESKLSYLHSRRTMSVFCLSFALSALPLIGRADTPVLIISLFCIILRAGELMNKLKPHPVWLPRILSVAVFAIIAFFLASNGIRTYLVTAFIDLLISSIALKFLEQSNDRDRTVHGMALIFMSSLPFLFLVEWYMMIYMTLTITVDFAVLMTIFSHSSRREILRYCVRLTLCSAPLAAIIFLALPRFNPFWQMPAQETAKTGLGDAIDFKSIAQLIQDNSVAFRANFEGDIPRARYFAAMRYPQFNPLTGGFEESRYQKMYEEGLTIFSVQRPHIMKNQNFVSGTIYHLYMEPSQRRWIPALETSVTFNDQIVYSPFGTWLDRLPVTQGRYYKFKYLTDPAEKALAMRSHSPGNQSMFLNTGNPDLNPETRELVKKLLKNSASPREFIARIFQYYNQEGFRYTLQPPQANPASPHIMDEFLFHNRNGFCNHYSAATAYMLRLAGIPSMVEGGYLGGQINQKENYVTVRNSDAHSWVLALINGTWQRFDPVTAIAPERVERSYGELQDPGEVSIFSPQSYQKVPLLSWFRNKIDELEFQWTRMILNYNFDDKESFLSRFFSENAILAAICLMITFAGSVYLTLILARLLKRGQPVSPLNREVSFFMEHLRKLRLVKKTEETLRIYFLRCAEHLKNPDLAKILREILQITETGLYSGKVTARDAVSKLHKLHKNFLRELKKEKELRKNSRLHF